MEVITSTKEETKRVDNVEFGTPVKLLDEPDCRYMVIDDECGAQVEYTSIVNIKTGKLKSIPDPTPVIIVDMVCSETE